MTEPTQDIEQGIRIPNAIWPDVNSLPEWAMLSAHLNQVIKSRNQYSSYHIYSGKTPIGNLL